MNFSTVNLEGLRPHFELRTLTLDTWKKVLHPLVGNLNYSGNEPVVSIFELMATTFRCQQMLVEQYTSTDYRDEYSAFYNRAFADIPRHCWRVHFLKERALTSSDVINNTGPFRDSYCGYCVLRPIPYFRVGETMLPCPYHKNGAALAHCVIDSEAHLMGFELPKIKAAPFVQQETHVMVCAEAALWMVTRYLHRRGECRRYRPSEITRQVIDPLYTSFVSEGLYMEQIAAVLQAMGIPRVLEHPRSSYDCCEQLYTYIESELPVIVALSRHVVTIVGHDYPNDVHFNDGEDSLGLKVNAFIAHNDVEGPYRRMTTRLGAAPAQRNMSLGGHEVLSYVVPLPERVNLSAQTALTMARALVGGSISKLLHEQEVRFGHVPVVWTDNELSGLVMRCYLRRGDTFKNDIVNHGNCMLPAFVFRYWIQPMPRYIWVIELCRRVDIPTDPVSRRIVGEILLDSTAGTDDPFEALIAFHLHGRMWIRQENHSILKAADFLSCEFEERYDPLIRRT